MDLKLDLQKLETPEDIQKLVSTLSEMADNLDVLYNTSAPNGNISGRQGQLCLYNNSGTYTLWINSTGSTVWQQVDASEDTNTTVKGWINFNGTTGEIAINDSYNVSSLVENSIGNYTINWDIDFANDDYCVAGISSTWHIIENTRNASSFSIVTYNATVIDDTPSVSIMAIGDQ